MPILQVTDDGPQTLRYPYTHRLAPKFTFEVDREKADELLAAHDYLKENDPDPDTGAVTRGELAAEEHKRRVARRKSE